ncbi:MAG: ATP-binding protein [Chloroflexota bacterium]
MSSEPISTDDLQPRELKTVYEISRAILRSIDAASALKEIIRLARQVFIFDNVVLYKLRADHSLEPTYARAVGRGRAAEADMAWGEAIAYDVLRDADIVMRREEVGTECDDQMSSRLNSRYFLGLPLRIGEGVRGALVFVRFGGPIYLSEQITIAGLIAENVERLVERQHLVGRIASLEAERRLDRLQEDFVATISHDLRSPLGFIKGYATTLLRDDTDWDAETRREFLTIIDEEADRLAELIDNLLDSSQLQAGTLRMEFQPLKLAPVLREFAHRIREGEFGLQVCLALESSRNTVWADITRLVQVFDNLFSNAAKYALGSTVTISLDWEPDQAHIRISDTGPGIPVEHLENIFQRFYRLPEHIGSKKGSGLGLFICREIIHAHHGKIFAEFLPGEGSTFHIYLPRQQPSDEAVPPLQEELS